MEKVVKKNPGKGQEGLFLTKQDPANIMDMTDLHSGAYIFPNLWIPRFKDS